MKQPLFFALKTFSLGICLLVIVACRTSSPTSALTPPPTVPPTIVPFPIPATPTATPEPKSKFRIVGYITDWGAPVAPQQIEKLTHINYAFALPRADGSLDFPANEWKLQQIVQTAHAKNSRVLIAVGGWGLEKEFETMAASPALRAKFVTGLIQYVDGNNLDGVDVDWEYPTGNAQSEHFLALMRELRAALAARNKLLTAAVAAYGYHGQGIPDETFALVDFLNVMAYDDSGAHHSTYAFAERSLDYWHARGLSQDKMVLGVPFYARPGGVSYGKLVKQDARAAQTDFFNYHGTLAAYNGLPTMRAKTQLAMQRANGIMIWSINDDAEGEHSLLNAISETAQGKIFQAPP